MRYIYDIGLSYILVSGIPGIARALSVLVSISSPLFAETFATNFDPNAKLTDGGQPGFRIEGGSGGDTIEGWTWHTQSSQVNQIPMFTSRRGQMVLLGEQEIRQGMRALPDEDNIEHYTSTGGFSFGWGPRNHGIALVRRLRSWGPVTVEFKWKHASADSGLSIDDGDGFKEMALKADGQRQACTFTPSNPDFGVALVGNIGRDTKNLLEMVSVTTTPRVTTILPESSWLRFWPFLVLFASIGLAFEFLRKKPIQKTPRHEG